MSYKVKFVKLYSSLEEINFSSKCQLCEIFTENTANNKCLFCNRYSLYTKETDSFLFTLKNFFVELAQKRDFFNLSWFDFQNLENELLKISEQNPCFQYNPYSLFYHVDCSKEIRNLDRCYETLRNIHAHISKQFDLHQSMLNTVEDLISKHIESVSNDSFNKFLYTCYTFTPQKITPNHNICRQKLCEMLCEKLEILN